MRITGQVNWSGVVKATLHPVQVQILEAAASCERLSPVEFSRQGAELSRVAYHFRALHRLGVLEPAGTAVRRGATEHYYRLSQSARGDRSP